MYSVCDVYVELKISIFSSPSHYQPIPGQSCFVMSLFSIGNNKNYTNDNIQVDNITLTFGLFFIFYIITTP